MFTFEVSINAIRAARTHAADKDVRYYLLGVHFDLEAGRIVATDGHRAFICAGPQMVSLPATFTMPNALIDNVLKAVGKRPLYDTVEVSYASGTVQVKTANGTFSAPAADGTFPDWRRVVPQSVSGETAQFNPEYLTDAREALATYQGFKTDKAAFHVAHNGASPSICTSNCDDAIVVVMPLRDMGAADAASRAAWAVSMANRDAAAANAATATTGEAA